MVAPRMAAFEAATMVKSLPVIPSRTSLDKIQVHIAMQTRDILHDEASAA